MRMPKTAVNQDHRSIFWEYEVGRARQSSIMEPEAETPNVERSSDNLFWLGIFPTDTGHHPAPDFGRNHVDHGDLGGGHQARLHDPAFLPGLQLGDARGDPVSNTGTLSHW